MAGPFLQQLDADAGRTVTEAEARAFAQKVLERSELTLDGAAVPWVFKDVSLPPYEALARGNDLLEIKAVAARRDSAGQHVLSYRNDFESATSVWMANIFLQPGAEWAYQVTGQERSKDGRQLTVHYEAGRPSSAGALTRAGPYQVTTGGGMPATTSRHTDHGQGDKPDRFSSLDRSKADPE